MQIDIRTLVRPRGDEAMHAHAADCRDLKAKYGPGKRFGNCDSWVLEAASVLDVVEAVYGDFPEWRDYVGMIHFAPCCGSLTTQPEGA